MCAAPVLVVSCPVIALLLLVRDAHKHRGSTLTPLRIEPRLICHGSVCSMASSPHCHSACCSDRHPSCTRSSAVGEVSVGVMPVLTSSGGRLPHAMRAVLRAFPCCSHCSALIATDLSLQNCVAPHAVLHCSSAHSHAQNRQLGWFLSPTKRQEPWCKPTP